MSAVLATQAQPTGLVEQPANEIFASSNASMMMDASTLNAMLAFADQMAKGAVTVPQHLRKQPADCLAVVMQAVQWGMNPFAVAQKTHIVNGTLGYEAQLVNAVLEQSGAIAGRFHYEYKGDGATLECRVGAVPRGEKDVVWGEWLASKDVTTKNSPLWKTNPKQQMGYLQVKNWARAFKPGAILGVYTAEELEDSPPPEYRDMGAADEVETAATRASNLLQGKRPDPPKLSAPKLDAVLNSIKQAATSADMEAVAAQCTLIANDDDKKIARKAYSDRTRELRASAEQGGAATTGPGGAPITFAGLADDINKAAAITVEFEDLLRSQMKALPPDQQAELVDALEVRKVELRG